MANKEKITIKLNNLKFDAQNPRLPMRLQGVTDENKVIDYMSLGCSYAPYGVNTF